MARKKRKKINMKVVAVLTVLGLGVVALGGLMAYKLIPKDPVALQKRAEAALNEPPENPSEHPGLEKNYPKAVRLLGEAIGAAKNREDLYIKLCLRYTELNLEWLNAMENPKPHQRRERLSKAISGLETARRMDNRNEKVLEQLGPLYLRTRQLGSYVGVLEDLIKVRPDEAALRYQRAQVMAAQGRRTQGKEGIQAIESFEKAIELDPNNPTYRLQFARFLRDYGRQTRSETVYQEAMKDLPSHSEIPRNYGAFLLSSNRPAAARDQFEAAIQREPNEPANHLMMGRFLMSQKEYEDAESYINQAIELDPNNPTPQLNFAELRMAQGELGKAVGRYRKATELHEARLETMDDASEVRKQQIRRGLASLRSRYANLVLELIARQPGNKEKLLAEAKKSLELLGKELPDSPEYEKLKGRILLIEGKTAEAIKHLESAHEKFKAQDRVDSRTGEFLAALYLAQGRPGKAETLLRELRGGGRGSGMGSLLRAQIEIDKGNYAQAASALEQVLRANPTHTRALNMHRAIRLILSEDSQLPSDLDMTEAVRKMLLREAERRWVEGNRAQAIALVENMHQREPEQIRLINRLASYYRRNEQDEKTRELLQQASRVHPDNEQIRHALKLLDVTDPKERYELQMQAVEKIEDPIARTMAKAQVAALYKKADEAIKHWTAAAELAMEDPKNPDPRAAGLVSRLLAMLQTKDETEKLRSWLQRASQADLDGANGQLLRADLAVAQNKHKEAISLLEPIAQERPHSKQIAARLGRSHLALQQYDQARQAFESALSNDSAYEPAVIGMMRVSAVLQPEEYPTWVQRAYRLAPRNTQVRSAYLDLEQRTSEDPAKLLAQREQLFRNDPKNVTNAIQLALLYEKNDDLDKARAVFEYLYNNLERKLVGAELLARFYQRTEQPDKLNALIAELRENKDVDPVEVNLLQAQLLARTDFSAARKAIEQAMDADPKDPRPYRMLTNLWVSAGKPGEAVQATEALLQTTGGSAADEKRLVRLLMDSGQETRAHQRLENMLQKDPRDAEALTLKGVLAIKQREPSKAMDALNKAIEARPRYAEPLRYRAILHESNGDLSAAVADLRRARQLEGGRATTLRLARLQIRRGDYVRAEELYKGLLRDNPGDRGVLDGLTNLYLQQRNWLALEQLLSDRKKAYPDSTAPYIAEARMWTVRDDDDRRIAALEKAVEIARTPETFSEYLRGLVLTGRFERALNAMKGDVPDGLENFTRIIRAAALAGTGKSDQADAIFADILPKVAQRETGAVVTMVTAGYGEKVGTQKLIDWIRLRPRDPLYLMQVAGLLTARGTKDSAAKAAQLYRQAVDLTPKGSGIQGEAFTGLGVSEYHRGNYEKARDAYLQALAIRPNNLRALNNLAYLFVDGLDDPAKALQYARKAVEYEPRNANVLDTYGWALAHDGQLTDARKALERAARLQRTPVVLHHLGWVYEQSDRLQDALQTYRDGLVLIEEGSPDPELKQTLDQAIQRVQKKRAEQRS